MKNEIKITHFIKTDLNEIGYEILNERRLSFSELLSKIEIKFSIGEMNGMPISRLFYKRKFYRLLQIKKNNVITEQFVRYTRNWDNSNYIEFLDD